LAAFKILHEYRQKDGQRERVVLVDAGQDSTAPKGRGFGVATNGILRESIRSSLNIQTATNIYKIAVFQEYHTIL